MNQLIKQEDGTYRLYSDTLNLFFKKNGMLYKTINLETNEVYHFLNKYEGQGYIPDLDELLSEINNFSMKESILSLRINLGKYTKDMDQEDAREVNSLAEMFISYVEEISDPCSKDDWIKYTRNDVESIVYFLSNSTYSSTIVGHVSDIARDTMMIFIAPEEMKRKIESVAYLVDGKIL